MKDVQHIKVPQDDDGQRLDRSHAVDGFDKQRLALAFRRIQGIQAHGAREAERRLVRLDGR